MQNTTKNFSMMKSTQKFNEDMEYSLAQNLLYQPADPLLPDIYEEKLLQVTRITKVVKGGKRMSFRVVLIVGDNQQKVGIGVGHGEDVSTATQKAISNGLKALISVPVTLKKSIPHALNFSYGAAQIMLKPAAEGAGIIAGGTMRSVLELAGLKNIVAKQRGANSILNNVKATILALNALNEKISLGIVQNNYRKLFYKKTMFKSIKPSLFT